MSAQRTVTKPISGSRWPARISWEVWLIRGRPQPCIARAMCPAHHLLETPVSKRTFQPNTRRRSKTHGFRLRMRTRAGRAILAARRRKGRGELSA